jgi:hypothetical protein
MGFVGRGGPKVPLGWTATGKNKGETGGLPRSHWAKMHSGCHNYFLKSGLRKKRFKSRRFKYFQTEIEFNSK